MSQVVRGSFRDSTISPVSFVPPRDPQFSATPVLASDVIHAQSKDLPRIFRVSAQGGIGPSPSLSHAGSVLVTAVSQLCASASHLTSTCRFSVATMSLPHSNEARACCV